MLVFAFFTELQLRFALRTAKEGKCDPESSPLVTEESTQALAVERMAACELECRRRRHQAKADRAANVILSWCHLTVSRSSL